MFFQGKKLFLRRNQNTFLELLLEDHTKSFEMFMKKIYIQTIPKQDILESVDKKANLN